jgi:regulation of enolase protein 1 (concanavalin A-like superfamily)
MVTDRTRSGRMPSWLRLISCLALACLALPAFGQVVADDFHACALDPVWTFVNPAGDGASVRIDGGYTADAHLSLSVPGGTTHEAWNTTLGAPRVEQPLADVDFNAAAKFVSVLPVNYSQQGLLVRQDDSHWLRLEIYRDPVGEFHVAAIGGPTTVFYDLTFNPTGATPLFLRVHRTGQVWTLSWSHDGSTWQVAGSPFTYELHPVAIGLYAGNRGANPPAHTVDVDWFGVDGAGDDLARNTLATAVAGGGLIQRTPELTNYACGQDVTLTAVDQLGWTFSGWSGALGGTANPAVLAMNGPATVTANFAPVPVDTLFATIVGGGALVLSPPGGVYNRGTVVTVTAVDLPGWAFAGFGGDLSGAATPQTVTVDGNRAVTATFAAVAQHSVTATVQPGDAGSVTLSPAGGLYNHGARVQVTATPTPGWAFAGWSGDLAGTANPDTLVVNADRDVIASFTALPSHTLTVTTTAGGHVLLTPDLPDYPAGAAVELTAVADQGWRFIGWSGDLSGAANPASLVMTGDRAVHATFAVVPPAFLPDDFNRCALGAPWTFVDPFLDGGTAAVTGGFTGQAGLAIGVPGGSEHEIWNGFIGAPHVLQPAEDVDFTAEAKFLADLPANFAQEGIVIKESETRWVRAELFRDETGRMRVAVDRGPNLLTHDVYLPVGTVPPLWMRVTRTGDTWVQSWSADGTTWNVANGPFTYDMTVSAIGLFAGNRGIAPPAHTVLVDYFHNTAGVPAGEDAAQAPLAVTLDGSGQVARALNLASYGCGQVETLTAIDQPGWRFVSWSGAVTGTQNPVQVALSGPAAVTAHFTPVAQHTLTTTVAAGNGTIQLSPPGGVYNEGARVVVTAVPAADWQFTGWSGDLAGLANPDTLVMTADRTVAASFEAIVYAFVSDDFHACTLNPMWTFVNPRGDGASWALTGSYTDDARLHLSVPGGASHELWNGAITAPYLIQPALDVDFTAEARFDSALPNAFFGQEGIIVRQDDAHWLRFEFAGFGPVTHVLATLPDGQTIPINAPIGANGPATMRVSRVGDTWHMQWSRDGVNWTTPPGSGFTHALDVAGVGLYAGNTGNSPAHTVAIDYFKLAPGPWVGEDAARAPLTVSLDGGGTVGALPAQASYACGETVTLTPVAARGWAFVGWSGALSGNQTPALLNMSGPAEVTAHFAPLPTQTVTVHTLGGGGTVALSPASGPYYYGDRVIFTAVDGPGWAFSGWNGDLSGPANPDTLVLTHDVTVIAGFAPVAQRTVTVSVPDGHGTVTLDPPGGIYNQGRTVRLTAHGATGFALGGWSGDLTGAANPATLVVDADKSVSAAFAPLPQYELTTQVAGSGAVTTAPAGSLHFAGTRVVLTAVAAVGWQFTGWTGDLSGTAAVDSLLMDTPHAVTATFAPLPPVALSDDFSACQLGPQWTLVDPYDDGATATLVNAFTDSARVAISVLSGFPHEIWAGVIGAAHILQPAVDRQQFTLEAKFDSRVPQHFGQEGIVVRQDEAHWVRAEFFRDELNLLRVAVDRGPAQITHDVYLPASVHEPLYMRLTRDGDQWTQSWSTDGTNWTVAGAPFPYTMTVHEVGLFAGNRGDMPPAHTVQVDYFHNGAGAPAGEDSLRNRLDLTIAGGGLVQRALGHVDYACGETETLTAVDQPGWVFAGWSGDFTGLQNPVTFTMSGPRAVTATFTAVPQYTLAATVAAGNGAVVLSPPGGIYNQGTVVTVTAVPQTGWGLEAWSGDLAGTSQVRTLVMTADRTVAATFVALDQHTLTLATLGQGTVSADPAGGTYYHGTRVALTAVPAPGWEFGGWSGALGGQANPDTVMVAGDQTVTATFLALDTAGQSDDFNACTLDPRWTVVDPLSDGGAATTVGTFTDNARVAISVPGGVAHEIWNGAIGAPHLRQPAADTHFVLEVKFDSLPPAGFGQQGLLVEEDGANWVRAEIFRDDTATLRIAADTGPALLRHDVALPPGLQAPLWLRLGRTGDTFTQWWSTDGATWTQAGTPFTYHLAVQAVGLYAGNRGVSPPAHTVLVDYFAAVPGAPAGEDARRNQLTVQVAGDGAVTRALDLADYDCGQVETLTAVPAPGWFFAGWSGAATGTQNPLALPMSGPVALTATFQAATAPNHLAVVPAPGTCLSQAVTCAGPVPVRLTRTEATPLRGFSLTLALANLELCAGEASVHEGDYLGALGATTFSVTPNLDGTVTVSGALLGEPCGATAPTGVLLWLDVAATIADGTGTITIIGAELQDCSLAALPVSVLPPATLPIDHTPPAAPASVTATQLLADNAQAALTAIDVAWVAPATPDAQAIEVWRKGFGFHPEYSDGGGAAPTAPAAGSDPAAAGWQLAATLPATASAFRDHPPVRDDWYYHVRVVDGCGNVGAAAALPAALDYLLADLVGGPGNLGDNRVDAGDVAALTAGYGRQEGQGGYVARLDVGPTADASPFSLPTTDNRVDFEDLMVFSLSHGLDATASGSGPLPSSPAPAARNFLMLDVAPLPAIGQTFTVSLVLDGDGTVQGLSLPLQWNAAAVQPLSVTAGPLLAAQGGTAAVYMPQPGHVDVALLGLRQRGLAGHGVLAVVTFGVVGPGQPGLGLGAVTARSRANGPLTVPSGGVTAAPDLPTAPVVTVLHPNAPNPFNPTTSITFDLARPGRVRLQVFGLDGRLVRVLADGDLPAGRHACTWDGVADDGRTLASGVYLLRLTTPDGAHTGRMTMLK